MTSTGDGGKTAAAPTRVTAPRIVIMGVSGSGKSTLGALLAARLGLDFLDADDFHSHRNKQKMEAGRPLTDSDRRDWLDLLAGQLAANGDHGVVLACSALKDAYRQRLAGGLDVQWVLLEGSYDLVAQRMADRPNHFFARQLLRSQFETLERPANAIVLDIRIPPEQLLADLLERLPRL